MANTTQVYFLLMLHDQCRLGGRVQPTLDQWALYLICVSTARRNCCNRENILKLPQATDTPHSLHVTDQKNPMPLSKFRVGQGEECKPTCAQKEKNWRCLKRSELVSPNTTEHQTTWPLLETEMCQKLWSALCFSPCHCSRLTL